MESKPGIASKTYAGILMMIAGFIGQIVLSNAPGITAFLLQYLPEFIAPYIPSAIFAIGTALAKYGRDKAEKPIDGWVRKKS